MKSSTTVNSTADRLKQWKSEKAATTKETTKQMPGTKRPGSSSSTTNGNHLKTSKSTTVGLQTSSGDQSIQPTDTTTIILEDVLEDVDGEYDVAYLQTIYKQLLLLRYRMLIQHSQENQIVEMDLLRGWKSVYDGEEEASAWYTREQIALTIIQTHQQLHLLRQQLEHVYEVVPRAHDLLSSIASAGLALSHRYPLMNVHPHMISSPIGQDGNITINHNHSHSHSNNNGSRSDGSHPGSPSRSGVGLIPQSTSETMSKGMMTPGSRSRSNSPSNRGHRSSSSSSSSSTVHWTETQWQELDETVAMRLHRLTQAFVAVQSVLTYDPMTVTRLANTLTTLSSLPKEILTRDHHIHTLLTQLETKVTSECSDLVSDRISYAIEQELYNHRTLMESTTCNNSTAESSALGEISGMSVPSIGNDTPNGSEKKKKKKKKEVSP